MDATMHIGMLVTVIVFHRLNNALRFLAAGARIEVHRSRPLTWCSGSETRANG